MNKLYAVLMVTLGVILGVTVGCRSVDSQVTNTFTAQGNITLTNSGTKGTQDQTAGKDFGEAFSGNKGEAAVGPLSRTGGSTGDNTVPTMPEEPEGLKEVLEAPKPQPE